MCGIIHGSAVRQKKNEIRKAEKQILEFKDFSQKSAYMSAHTLQGPVPTVDLRTSKMKQRNTMYTH